MTAVIGVDGCPRGWIAVWQGGPGPAAAVFRSFADLIAAFPGDAVVAVDMPIGLPAFTGPGGRGPERLVRPLLGQRQSSVFSIPARAAVYAEIASCMTPDDWHEAHRRASDVARLTSDPPRAISIQAFGIFPKIREVDSLLRERAQLRDRVFESHPEVAFAHLNGMQPMTSPKKIRNVINPAGMEERKALLCRHGYTRAFLDSRPPAGARADDFLDAACMMLVAARIARGQAVSYPNSPEHDAFGIPVAIHA